MGHNRDRVLRNRRGGVERDDVDGQIVGGLGGTILTRCCVISHRLLCRLVRVRPRAVGRSCTLLIEG